MAASSGTSLAKTSMRKPLPVVHVMLGFAGLFFVGTAVTSVAAAQGQPLLLNESQILYLSSTSAQVVAAAYGLTLTGFEFSKNYEQIQAALGSAAEQYLGNRPTGERAAGEAHGLETG